MIVGTIKAGTRVSFNGTDNYAWINLTKHVRGSDDTYGIVEKTIHRNDNLIPVIVFSRKEDKLVRLVNDRSTFFIRSMLELE